MPSPIPPQQPPGSPPADPRIDELLRRVAALEQRLADIPSASPPAVAVPATPPPIPTVAAPPQPHADFIERLADFKRDARASRIQQSSLDQPETAPAPAPADDAFETGEFEAILPESPAAPTSPPIAPPPAALPTIYPPAPNPHSPVPAAYPPPPPAAPRTAPTFQSVPIVLPPPAPRPTLAPAAMAPRTPPPAKPARPSKPVMSLESLIGFKGFMFVGSIILIIGVIMGLKFGMDQGWFRMPPAFRCIAAAMFGAALLGAGELARRKINALASAGLSAAGIATMYGAAWAAYGLFKIVDAPLGFTLLAAAAGIGIFVALRAGLVSVAIVSLLGAYLAPMIARSGNSPALVMPAYLFAILILGLTLAARRPRPFRALRGLVWWGTVILGTWSVFHAADLGQPLVGIGFLGLVWAAVHAELWYGARKAPEISGPPDAKGLTWRATRPILSTFATSMWCAATGVWSLNFVSGGVFLQDWMVTGALAVAAGVASMVLAGNLRVLIDTPDNDGERLGAALMTQAGALFIATVALGLAGWAEVLAGILIGVAAVFAGRWIKSRAMDVYGLIVLALTVGRMVVYDSWAAGISGPAVPGSMLLGLSITDWTLLMLGAAAGWAAAGVLLLRSQAVGAWRSLGVWCIGIALTVGFAGFFSSHAQPESLITLLLLVALAAFGLSRLLSASGLAVYALALLCGAVAELLLIETQPLRALSPVHPGLIILGISLTKWTGLMLAAGASWAIVGLTLIRVGRAGTDDSARPGGIACVAIALCVAFAAFVSPNAAAQALLVFAILFSVAAFGVGNALRSSAITGGAVAALGGASVIACILQVIHPEDLTTWRWQAGGIIVSRWGMAMMLGALVWSGFAFVLRRVWAARSDFFRDLSVLAAVLAAVMLFAATLAPGSTHGPVVWVWLALSLLILAVHRFVPRMYLDVVALAGLVAASGLWTMTYPLAEWTVSTRPIGLHAGLIQGLALAAGFWCAAGFLWKRIGRVGAPSVPELLQYAVALAITLIFVSTSLEVRRAALMFVDNDNGQRAALSIWWGIFGLVLIGAGFWRRVPLVRHSGLALMTIAVAKATFFDLANVPPGWRVVLFLGLGLMMLAVGVGYAKAHATLEKSASPPDPADPLNPAPLPENP